jgi:hypothetical protein
MRRRNRRSRMKTAKERGDESTRKGVKGECVLRKGGARSYLKDFSRQGGIERERGNKKIAKGSRKSRHDL